jgi:hydrophobic/amphiphilic exporter-1 (mainly G- bacteria), HAE1 family
MSTKPRKNKLNLELPINPIMENNVILPEMAKTEIIDVVKRRVIANEVMQQDVTPPLSAHKKDFNYYITKFFLDNTRLTILSLIFFVLVGSFITFNLKTTGFPSPSVPVALINTVYPGASSDAVAKNITIPLESAIKDVKGVKRYASTSSNSVSIISASLDETANADSVKNAIESAIKSVQLPTGVDAPRVFSLEIGGPDFYFSVLTPNPETTFDKYIKTRDLLLNLDGISSVTPIKKLNESINININKAKLKESGLTIEQVQAKVASFGESIPAVSNVTFDGKNTGIQTSLKNNGLEDLKNLTFNVVNTSAVAPQIPTGAPVVAPITSTTKKVSLLEFAAVEKKYAFDNEGQSYYTFNHDGKSVVAPSLTFTIKAKKDVDLKALEVDIKKQFEKIDNFKYETPETLGEDYNADGSYIVSAFNQVSESQKQVKEVVSGLIGGPADYLGEFRQFGWLLGGIQLVMLVMIALVSWRAAIISTLAIPLSFAFSTITLGLLGESLNTLTLFSLVLVTGIVVDPALVVLEAIQRKVDSGLKGSVAVLAAVKDVGLGVFLAMVTNIIVFVPFGVLSGVFGQIFRYIPLTVVPAIVGSYLVPLVVLAWFGGLLLKKSSNSRGVSEEENLWGIAKWLINFNKRILHSPIWARFLIIALIFAASLSLAGFMISTGKIKTVQFAQSDNVNELVLSGTFLNKIPNTQRVQTAKQVLEAIGKEKNVVSILEAQGQGGAGFNYYLFLKDKNERKDQTSNDIVESINETLRNEFGENAGEKKKFFDIKTIALQSGGPVADYQVAISIKSEDGEKTRKAADSIKNLMLNEVCFDKEKNTIKLDKTCNEDGRIVTKVDDGFAEKDNLVYDFLLDREKLLENNLATLGRGPLTLQVNSLIKSEFQINRNDKVAKITDSGREIDVVMSVDSKPQTLDELKGKVKDSTKKEITDLGEFVETKPKSSIQRNRGQTVAQVQARLKTEFNSNQGIIGQVGGLISKYYNDDNGKNSKELGLEKDSIGTFSDGSAADFAKSFGQLGIALLLAIIVSYIVFVVFFNSFLQPLSILYSIPLTFFGIFPALYFFVGGQFGFLEIIGLIILIGIVENVAIFLLDGARQYELEKGISKKDAIALASGIRLRPVMLTKITTLVSLAPLAITSEFYRSISVVIIFGLLVSGFLSLITTPILYIFFAWLSNKYRNSNWLMKILFFVFGPLFVIYWWIIDIRNRV